MKFRNSISITIGLSFLVIGVSGVLMYSYPYNRITATIHAIFGFIFIAIAFWHNKNNWNALRKYTTEKRKGKKFENGWLKMEFVISFGMIGSFLAGSYFQLNPFRKIYDWGNQLRASREVSQIDNDYERVTTNTHGIGLKINLEVKKGPYYNNPIMAVWMEDTAGNYLQTLYVVKSIATSIFNYGSVDEKGNWKPDIVRRPEALPYWSHKRGVKSEDGYFIPSQDKPIADAYTGATPRTNFVLESRADYPLKDRFVVLMEVNRSYDWNEFYTREKFPDDPIYSGSGQNGQPSVIYAAEVIPQNGKYHLMIPIGHGHHSGQSGQLYSNMENISTALEIIDRAILEVETPNNL